MIEKVKGMTGEEKGIAVVIVVLMGVGAYFRLTYLMTVSPHVDEYLTIWAAQKIIEHGYPLLPSGFIGRCPRGSWGSSGAGLVEAGW